MNQFFKIDDSKSRHYGLDLMRALAIISVILYHFPRDQKDIFLRAISHYGYLGVDIFFVLSGFLIGGQTFSKIKRENSFNFKEFCRRRFYRTLPNYYFILLIFIFIEGIDRYSWKFLFFLQNIGGLYSFTHSWSLCIEEHFYLLFPLLILFLLKTKNIKHYPYYTLLIFITSILIRFVIWKELRPDLTYKENIDMGFDQYFSHIFYPTYTRLDGISVGTFLAYLSHFKKSQWEKLTQRSSLFLGLSIALFLLTSVLSWKRVGFFASVFSFSFYSISFGCLLISLIRPDSLLYRIKIPFIKEVSLLSYSLYLTHTFAIKLIDHTFQQMQFQSLWPNWLTIFPASLFLAYLLYVFLEKPVLRLRDKKIKHV